MVFNAQGGPAKIKSYWLLQEFIKEKEKLDIAKAKAAGKSENEIFKIQQKARASNIESLQRSYDEIKGIDEARADEIKKQIKQINNDGQVAELDNQTRLKKIKDDAAKQAADDKKKADDEIIADLKSQQDALKNIIAKTRIHDLKCIVSCVMVTCLIDAICLVDYIG